MVAEKVRFHLADGGPERPVLLCGPKVRIVSRGGATKPAQLTKPPKPPPHDRNGPSDSKHKAEPGPARILGTRMGRFP